MSENYDSPDYVDAPEFDVGRVEKAVRELLIAIGEDPDRPGLKDTPTRVAGAYREVFGGIRLSPAEALDTFFEIGHDELVLVKDIEVYSMCEHHLLPFHGVAHVAYIPDKHGRVTGLSKLARLVDVFARRPQVQERLTGQIADALVSHLDAQGVLVVVDCVHMCMSIRGVRKPGARTVTSAVRGQMRDLSTRAEVMSLIDLKTG
ncbi:MAG TPA: GTP cyclohydrolase I FolE [Beutenbergiaceae bacterium]|nr:GTP cyclohydrolase I FolE [Beutenbergiaceae bacterium]